MYTFMVNAADSSNVANFAARQLATIEHRFQYAACLRRQLVQARFLFGPAALAASSTARSVNSLR